MKLKRDVPNKVVRVVCMDTGTGLSKSITVYDTTPEDVVDEIRSALQRKVRRLERSIKDAK